MGLLLATLCLLMGCPASPPEQPDSGDVPVECLSVDPWLEIGTGEAAFEAFPEPPAVVMVHGPQGGWHVLGSARIWHTSEFVRITYTITDVASGQRVALNQYSVALQMDDDCSGTFVGMYAFLDVASLATDELTTPPQLLFDHELLVSMSIEDEDGRTATAEATVTAQRDPDDIPSD